MTTLNLTTQDFNAMPLELRLSLLSLCLSLVGKDNFQLIIDNATIKDRDNFFDWKVANLKLTK
jgi:hypothetical protein